MKVRYSYLNQQFEECDDLWQDLRAFVATGDFTLGAALEEKELERKLSSNAIVTNRGYPFCIYPGSMLEELFRLRI